MKKKGRVAKWSVLTGVSAVLTAAAMIATPIAMNYATVINIYLGTSSYKLVTADTDEDTQYFKSSFDNEEDLVNFEQALCRQVEGEGAVLLLNRDNALPLSSNAKVSTFCRSSTDLVYGGTGSGQVSLDNAPTLKSALNEDGVEVNDTLWNFYTSPLVFVNNHQRERTNVSFRRTNN